jgi:hypothetical protein
MKHQVQDVISEWTSWLFCLYVLNLFSNHRINKGSRLLVVVGAWMSNEICIILFLRGVSSFRWTNHWPKTYLYALLTNATSAWFNRWFCTCSTIYVNRGSNCTGNHCNFSYLNFCF